MQQTFIVNIDTLCNVFSSIPSIAYDTIVWLQTQPFSESTVSS